MTASPVGSSGVSGPVDGRSVGEIRADLAHCDRGGTPWPAAARRLLADVPQLLAEVEAAHRFEVSAAAEREALLAEVEGLRRELTAVGDGFDDLTDAWRDLAAERDSLRGVVQAVEAALDRIEQHAGAKYDYQVAQELRGLIPRAALAAAADAPRRPRTVSDE